VGVIEGEKRQFMTGNEVVAWAALAAGAKAMFGYPITPQNEIMHYWTRMAPEYGLKFLQTEDELSAGFATLGGALAGTITFCATAGPGNVLMQEPISMAEMMRVPAVWVIQQRGGPSTATVIYSQQETRLTCLGGNGEGLRIVYSTASHQDMFDYVIKAFWAAWKFRFPAFVLGDGYQAKMREPVTIYDPEGAGVELPVAAPILKPSGVPSVDREPVHMRNTFNIEEELMDVLMEHIRDYSEMAPQIVESEKYLCEDAEILVVAHGIVWRSAKEAVLGLRERGVSAGAFRPITLRPFPEDDLRAAARTAELIVVAESAYGQLESMVRDRLYRIQVPIKGILKPGVGITAEEIVEGVTQLAEMSRSEG